jgi:Leucine-rich repeat (LRR) protein
MKNTITLWLIILSTTCFAQTTYIPDNNFEQALIDLGYDDIIDNTVITNNINIITSLNVSSLNISDLTGIEDFTALVNLFCNDNQLTSIDISTLSNLSQFRCHNNLLTNLDVSNNNSLNRLICSDNQLTDIDISMHPNFLMLRCSYNPISSLNLTQNPNLNNLSCRDMMLSSLDVSQNTNLTQLFCDGNQITSLDLSLNTELTSIRCHSNALTSLNINNNNNVSINDFNASNNPNLTCIQVDDAAWSSTNWVLIDSQTSFSESCDTNNVSENNFDLNLRLYPNPIDKIFFIDLGENYKEIDISISDMAGKIILSQQFQNKKNLNLNIEAETGVYFLSVNTKDKKETIKLIKK